MLESFTCAHTFFFPTCHPTWSSHWERSVIVNVNAHRLDVIFEADWFSQL